MGLTHSAALMKLHLRGNEISKMVVGYADNNFEIVIPGHKVVLQILLENAILRLTQMQKKRFRSMKRFE